MVACNNWFIAYIIYSKRRRGREMCRLGSLFRSIFTPFVFRGRMACFFFKYPAEILRGGESATICDFRYAEFSFFEIFRSLSDTNLLYQVDRRNAGKRFYFPVKDRPTDVLRVGEVFYFEVAVLDIVFDFLYRLAHECIVETGQ